MSVHRIELVPNGSLSWQTAAIFFGSIAGASLFIALVFVAQGYWPILPFAGLELGLLGWALWHSMRKSRQRDTLLLEPQRIVVEKYRLNGHQRMEFPRSWTQARLEPSEHRHHPSRLVLRGHGRSCEIGDFLTDDERASLQVRLTELLAQGSGVVHGKPAGL
ncbi:MAG: DUF2244 domain-containing protein [Gammaproteobacteria bacterium]|nr:DUF2244 domain-containing protein [Gammaproteobacteria bacterium]